MTCENCGHELYEQEEYYFICPECAEVIVSNLEDDSELNIAKTRVDGFRYAQLKKLLFFAKTPLLLSAAILPILFTLLSSDDYRIFEHTRTFSHYRSHGIYHGYSNSVLAILLPTILFLLVYFLFHKFNPLTSSLLGDLMWYTNSMWFTIIKAFIYLIVLLLVLKIEPPIFQKYMLSNVDYSRYIPYTEEEIAKGLSTVMKDHTIVLIYSCVVCYVMELMDMFQQYFIRNLNEDYE